MYNFAIVASTALLLLTATTAMIPARAHEDHGNYSAGEPGDPKKPARTIRVLMVDYGSEQDMKFEPNVITVRKGEQIRFVLENSGTESHEFMLATVAEIFCNGQTGKGHTGAGAGGFVHLSKYKCCF